MPFLPENLPDRTPLQSAASIHQSVIHVALFCEGCRRYRWNRKNNGKVSVQKSVPKLASYLLSVSGSLQIVFRHILKPVFLFKFILKETHSSTGSFHLD
jgi:hypothetical protein